MSLQNLRLTHTSDTHLGDDLGHPSSNDALALVISETIILEADFLHIRVLILLNFFQAD